MSRGGVHNSQGSTDTADSTGKASYTTTARYNGTWRAVTAARNLTWASSTSKTLTSHVSAVLTVSKPATRAVHGKPVSYSALSSPFSRVGTLTLRVYRPGTTDLTDTYSSSWTVKVS